MSVRLRTPPHVYEIQEILSESPVSVVYLADRSDTNLSLKQKVVIKVFKQKERHLPHWQMRSLLRARHSSHLVKILAFEQLQSRGALILEYIRGVNLKQLLKTTALNAEDNHYICTQVLHGLKELKQNKMCHGDLSLNNILIESTGRVLLTDYGLANYANACIYTTRPFNAPELKSGTLPNFQSDLFSLGVLEKVLKNQLFPNPLQSMENEHFICKKDPLLDPDPKNRRVKSFLHPLSTRLVLSAKIKTTLSKNPFSKPAHSLPMFLKKKPHSLTHQKTFYLIASFVLFFFLIHPSSSRPYRLIFYPLKYSSTLSISTSHWVYVEVAGQKGYTPINISLDQPGTYQIKWKSLKHQGKKQITIAHGQTLFLTDSDFKNQSALLKKSSSTLHP